MLFGSSALLARCVRVGIQATANNPIVQQVRVDAIGHRHCHDRNALPLAFLDQSNLEIGYAAAPVPILAEFPCIPLFA